MATKKANNRRRLLKALAGAGGVFTAGKLLPEQWTRPVVDAVTLPAHAQTSATYFGVVDPGNQGKAPRAEDSILDLVVPNAHAQGRGSVYICVLPLGASVQFDVVFRYYYFKVPGVHFGGVVPIGGDTTALNFIASSDGCPRPKGNVAARVDEISDLAKGEIIVDGKFLTFGYRLPFSPCNLPDLGVCDDVIDFDDTDDNAPLNTE